MMAPTTTPRAMAFGALFIVSVTLPEPVTAQGPILELHHVYIIVPPGAAAALQALRQVGIVIDTETVRHGGEGTTSLAAFFENAYLELMWVDSSVAVDSAHQLDVADFRRAAAWRRTGARPFGIGLHFLSGSPSALSIPFRLDAVPGTRPVANYVLLRQPEESLAADVFVMPPDGAVTSWLGGYRERQPDRFAHPAGLRRITRVVVGAPRRFAALDVRQVRFVESSEPLLLKVEFDGGHRGQTWDLRPALPVILSR